MSHDELITDEVTLTPKVYTEFEADEVLRQLMRSRRPRLGLKENWDPPFDLRVVRPRAVDLRTLWERTGQEVPPHIAAALGPQRPVLLHHTVTPFPPNGKSPVSPWGLGYEFVVHDVDANTESVLPNDQVLQIARVGQNVELGLEFGGTVGIPEEALELVTAVPAVSLTGAQVTASTNQKYSFALSMMITLRKVIGAPVGVGGAQWKMYRQDERLDRPHPLIQTLLVPEKVKTIRCTIRTWAKQAGFFGSRIGEKFWRYDDQNFSVDVRN